MYLRYLYGVIIVSILLYVPLSAQETKIAHKKRKSEFYFNISDRGTGVGVRLLYDREKKIDTIGYGILIAGIRGEKEYIYSNPYSYYSYPEKRGSKFFTIVTPVTATYKKYVFTESIQPNLRPYINFDVGPVYGISFPKGVGGFSKSMSKGKGQITAGAFIGFGVDIYAGSGGMYGASLLYQYYRFPTVLGERKEYAGMALRLSFISTF